jgi:replication initiator protein RepSA
MLGFGGHFATKSRRYFTTLTALREVRRAFQRGQQPAEPEHEPHHLDEDSAAADVVITHTFEGVGWLTTADAQLANTAAAKAREYRLTAREEHGALISERR